MSVALYTQILNDNSYRSKLRDIVDFDDVIDYMISEEIIKERDYMKIWEYDGDKLDSLFDVLKNKRKNLLARSFTIFQSLYEDKYDVVLRDIKREIVGNVHLKGGFPKLNICVPRIEKENEIKSKLPQITWDESLVVYGRVGEGKSYLVCKCLKDEDLIWEHFENRIFWINGGDCLNGINVLQPLTRLLKMVKQVKRKIFDLDDIIEQLRSLFSSNKLRKSLVVLDNARSLDVIRTFQEIKCKLIIITHFKEIKHAEFVQVDDGFTLSETVDLFAQHLGISEEELSNNFSDDIKEIHDLCKGHPSTLALLAVSLSWKRDQAVNNKKPWNEIKEKIDKGEMDDPQNDDVEKIQMKFRKALKMCIDTIQSRELKEIYYQFAVFPKDANISTKVLEVFLEKTPDQVSEIMQHFENRSLINSFYNWKKDVYIYVIHDLFLNYLKCETRAHKKTFHQKLIRSYEKNHEFHTLPDDNYILLFLGYHLKHAEMFDRFERFLDLDFIIYKIRIVGVNNMEQDLRTYQEEIVNNNPTLISKFDKCLKLIKENKHELQHLHKIDIIQLALPTLGDDAQTLIVRNQANAINKLYLQTKFSAGRLKTSQKIFMQEVVTATAYCTDKNISKILLGLETGDIVLYCLQMNKEFERFQGHKDAVYDLKVANDNTCFLSISKDCSVKLWQFFSQRLSVDGDIPTSPKCVQHEYVHPFNVGKRNTFREFMFNEEKSYITSANFANRYSETKLICAGCKNGRVVVWNAFTREKLVTTTETGYSVDNVHFSLDDSKIFFTKQDKIQIYNYVKDKLDYSDSIHNVEDIVKLFIPNENTLICVGSKHVMMYKIPVEDYYDRRQVFETTEQITCSAVANGEYFAIGINKKVHIFSVALRNCVEVLEHNKPVTAISMDLAREDDNNLTRILMNFDDNNLQQCNIMMQSYAQLRNKPDLVTAHWKNKHTPMLALVQNGNVLKIQHEFNTINEHYEKEMITCITFSLSGTIIFSLESGSIIEYNYKRQNSFETLIQLKDKIKYLECFDNDKTAQESIVAITDGVTKIHVRFNNHWRSFYWEFPIFTVFPIPGAQLLYIDVYGAICKLDMLQTDDNPDWISYDAEWGRTIDATAFCPRKHHIAVAFTEHTGAHYFEVINVKSKEKLTNGLLIEFRARCAAFSHSGELLVLAGDDGKLMVVHSNFKITFISNSGPSIRFVQFSKSRFPILVAVGREVSWWNLKSLEVESIAEDYTTDFDVDFWANKTVHNDIMHLLQTVSLYSDAVHFSVSKNFETFLVVDDESRFYVMKCFKNVQ